MINQKLDGFFLVYKEPGWTSRDVCNKIRKLFSIAKVGHSGTLDPFAEGLLIVACNNATKLLPYVKDEPKQYEAVIKLGVKTSSGDLTGEVIVSKEINHIKESELAAIISDFIGEQEQIPPMTSAIHVNGMKLYKLAHQGIEIERKPRNIRVFDAKLMFFENDLISFSCSVSKGTYIRVLGEDIAFKSGNVGHLVSLKRTSIDKINIKEAKRIDELTLDDLKGMENFLTLEKLYLLEEQYKLVLHGNPISLNGEHDETILCLFEHDEKVETIAVYQKMNDGKYYSIRGIKVL